MKVTVWKKKRGRGSGRRGRGGAINLAVSYPDDFVLYPGAKELIAFISEAVHEAHVTAVKLGQDPTGKQHPPLKEGTIADRMARKGRRPDERGNTGYKRNFVDNLTRAKVGGNDKRATARIRPGRGRAFDLWLSNELKRGIEYFGVGGDVDRMIDLAIEDWLDQVMQEKQPKPKRGLGRITGRKVG